MLRLSIQGKQNSAGPVALMYHALEDCVQTPAWKWSVSANRFNDQIRLLHEAGRTTCAIRELVGPSRIATGANAVAITFDDGFANNLDAAAALEARAMRATFFIVTGSIGQVPYWPDSGRPAGRLLNAEEIRQLDAAGMEIGAHGVDHVRLPGLTDEALAREVRDSKSALEDILGKPVTSFAYPYGAWDARCEDAVRTAGYSAACTTQPGAALKDGNPYRLRRLEIVNRDTAARFTRKLALLTNDGGFAPLLRYVGKRLYARARGLSR
ncbi:MAG: polysaccharide deacetylase family protein [Gammaproteobacteria bacterium]|nr:polysaccharide deacetylase family protein [Gammaproteobacteria bacterium]